MDSADIAVYCHPIIGKGSRVFVEAMAMGTPIVTTDNVGCREVVEEENGFLVQRRETCQFAAAIEKLVSDDERRRLFGERSRQKAGAEFDEVAIIKRIMTELGQIRAMNAGAACNNLVTLPTEHLKPSSLGVHTRRILIVKRASSGDRLASAR